MKSPNASESHYLNCIDPNCELAYCVGQRDFQSQIATLEMANQKQAERVTQLCAQRDNWQSNAVALKDKLMSERTENARLREALETIRNHAIWYADVHHGPEHEVHHALKVEVQDMAQKALDVTRQVANDPCANGDKGSGNAGCTQRPKDAHPRDSTDTTGGGQVGGPAFAATTVQDSGEK